jgi:hypothetical protein
MDTRLLLSKLYGLVVIFEDHGEHFAADNLREVLNEFTHKENIGIELDAILVATRRDT